MNKANLCQHMVRHFASRARTDDDRQLHRINRQVAREFFEELSRLCIRELRTRGKFSIPHVGKLVVAPRRPRRGRDPVTGNPIVIPARRVVRARISGRVRGEIEESRNADR